VLVELVGADSLDEIINSSFNFVVLASKLLRLNGDPFFLHLYKLVKSVSLSILRQVNQDSLGEGFKVVLDSVFHNIIDVNDELFEFGKTLVHMGQVAINVHWGPGERDHTGAEFVLEIFQVGHEERLSVRSDLVNDSFVFAEHKLELRVVVLEFLFL